MELLGQLCYTNPTNQKSNPNIVQLFLGLVLGSLLQLIFPFLTQGIVDYGIRNQNLGFVFATNTLIKV